MSGKCLRFLRKALVVFAGLLALYFVVRGEENWRGARALAQCEQKLREAGESLELRSFLPAPVPDAENFAAAPIVQQLIGIAATKGDRKLIAEEERLEEVSLLPKPIKPGRPSAGTGRQARQSTFRSGPNTWKSRRLRRTTPRSR